MMLEKTNDAGKDRTQMEKGVAEDEIDSITVSMDTNLSKLWEIADDKGVWHATIHGIAESDST